MPRINWYDEELQDVADTIDICRTCAEDQLVSEEGLFMVDGPFDPVKCVFLPVPDGMSCEMFEPDIQYEWEDVNYYCHFCGQPLGKQDQEVP